MGVDNVALFQKLKVVLGEGNHFEFSSPIRHECLVQLAILEKHFELVQLVVNVEHRLVECQVLGVIGERLNYADHIERVDWSNRSPLFHKLQGMVDHFGVKVIHILGVGRVL